MKRFQFWAGFFCGVVLLGGVTTAADAASGIIAALSSQPIYVDGVRVPMTAYAINGSNYVRLRDIGKAVDFGVTYDAATKEPLRNNLYALPLTSTLPTAFKPALCSINFLTVPNSVHIDPDAPYQEQVSQPAPSTPAPSAVTEESVKATLAGLKTRYPAMSTYPSPYTSSSNPPYGAVSMNCAGWATLCSDAAFGNLPWRRVDRPEWEEIRPGDLIEMRNNSFNHGVIVLERRDDCVLVTESGKNQKVYWGAQYFKWWLEDLDTYAIYTRYPD